MRDSMHDWTMTLPEVMGNYAKILVLGSTLMSCWSGGLRDSNVNAGFHQSIQNRWGDLTAADSTHLDWKILGNQARIELQASSLLDKVRKVKSVMKAAREE